MDALVMCGGRGTRLAVDREKPLVRVDGVPMVRRVVLALERATGIGAIHAAVSPHTPETREFLHGRVPLVETAGDGYVEDLGAALADPRVDRPLLTAVADLPLLAPSLVDDTVEIHTDGDLTVCVAAALKSVLGVSAETTRTHGGREVAPAGLNVVGSNDDGDDSGTTADQEILRVTWDVRLAVNVNYREDLTVAERLLDAAGGMDGPR